MLNVMAGASHLLMTTDYLPIYTSCFGRTMHAARIAEWIPVVCFLTVICNALDCPDWHTFFRSSICQTISICGGCASIMSCHVIRTIQGKKTCGTEVDSAYYVALFFLVVSFVFFLDIFRLPLIRRPRTLAEQQATHLSWW